MFAKLYRTCASYGGLGTPQATCALARDALAGKNAELRASQSPAVVVCPQQEQGSSSATCTLAISPPAQLRHLRSAGRAGYVLGPVLGKGGFCSVRKALHELTGQTVACKIIEKGRLKVGSLWRPL
jgi:hypothetical protein